MLATDQRITLWPPGGAGWLSHNGSCSQWIFRTSQLEVEDRRKGNQRSADLDRKDAQRLPWVAK